MEEFELFRSSPSGEEICSLSLWLQQNGIETKIEKSGPLKVNENSELIEMHFLSIAVADFDKGNDLADQHILNNFSSLPKDYYLFSYPDDGLIDIVKNTEDKHDEDYIIAKRILEDRDITYHD